MKKLLEEHLFKKILLLISISFVCFFAGYFIAECKNYYSSYYSCVFTCNETINEAEIVDVNYLNAIKDSASKYANIDVSKMLKEDGFNLISYGNDTYEIRSGYKYYDIFFNSAIKNTGTRAKTFIKDALNGLGKNVTFKNQKDIVTRVNYASNSWLYGVLLIFVGIFVYGKVNYQRKLTKSDNEFTYDSVTTFKTVFKKAYWKMSATSVKSIKDITTIAMLFALMLACKFIPIPSGWGNLGISFTFIFFAMVGMIYGPIYAFVIGIFSDIIGYFINSTGTFFLGYTIQAALTGMIYGLCFYKTKVSFAKILLARLLVNMLMNVVLGSILYTMVFTESAYFSQEFNSYAKAYALYLSLPKNIFYLFPQSILLFTIIKAVSPVLYRFKLIEKETYKHLSLI